jgi:energy-converting hydrogenase Eha subunit H
MPFADALSQPENEMAGRHRRKKHKEELIKDPEQKALEALAMVAYLYWKGMQYGKES